MARDDSAAPRSQTSSPRSYRTSIKRGEAAAVIIAAASSLFARHGFAGTSIEDIVREAGVARPTVFSAVGTKATIFRAVLEAAVVGSGPVVPVVEQPWFRSAVEQRTQVELLRAFARAVREIGERISDLYWAAECAAEYDDEVRELWEDVEGERIATGVPVAHALRELGPLRADYDEETAAVAITAIASPASWRALVRDAHWTPQQFEDWVTDTLSRALLP